MQPLKSSKARHYRQPCSVGSASLPAHVLVFDGKVRTQQLKFPTHLRPSVPIQSNGIEISQKRQAAESNPQIRLHSIGVLA